jgi:hypothetical protein
MPAQEEIIHDSGIGKQLDVLKGAGHAFAGNPIGGKAHNVFTITDDPAMVWLIDAVDKIENGGLSGTIGPDDGKDRILLHAETDVAHCLQAAEADAQIFNLEMIHCRRFHPFSYLELCHGS